MRTNHILRTPIRSAARVAAVFGVAALAVPTAASAATEVLYATTPANDLISFTAQAPSVLKSREPIAGLAAGETIIGMDRRPATAQLYALTSAGRVIVIDRTSGETKQITPAPLTLTGTSFGFDFNPAVDRIRIVSDANMNLRVHPDTGALVATDGMLAYAVGDANAGADPSVGGGAYSNSGFGGAAPATTTLFDIDTLRDSYARQDPPNDGTLVTVGALGVDAVEPVQFDVAGGGTQYAAFATNTNAAMRLWSIAANGAATPASTTSTLPVATITSLAGVGEVGSDASAPFVAIGNYTTYRGAWLSRGLRFTVTCVTECSTEATLRIGTTVAGTASADLTTAGTRAPLIKLNAAGRTAAAGTGRIGASLTFITTDGSNNSRTQVVQFASLQGVNTAG